MGVYKSLLKPVFFLFDPEKIHHVVVLSLRVLGRIPGMKFLLRKLFVKQDPRLERNIFSIQFPNPVGLAAGFDKDAKLIPELACLGFGFIEVGTVTPKAQPGNPKPRMFRLKQDAGIINRMGFNNEGVEAMVQRLQNRPAHVIVGGNIGKNKSTPNEQAIQDYDICFRALFPFVDYFVVNVSSPNTPDLRSLQEKEPLLALLSHLQKLNAQLSAGSDGANADNNLKRKPLLLKIAPDLTNAQLDEIIEVTLETKLDGIIATNTTISRNGLKADQVTIEEIGAGGLSGKPLTSRSTEVIRYLADKAQGRYKIIGVGGIHSPEDALEKLEAGASLIQLYTGFIYEGPGLVKKISEELLKHSQ
ncbi:MAG: quinone-dependent dihydroorotate dehydrogenase [Bacteroidetes bacterium]|nr:quinone-dependent dihydroorotate dehydrogenase [Bacteroidota bacterium]MBL0139487.1 quinone-dependent dihydroorotate dehydrogenase [Bacteroidota bacterium]